METINFSINSDITYTTDPELKSNVEYVDNVALFKKDLAYVINKHSMENGSNTPDYVLAEYLYNCLLAFNTATKQKDEFYNVIINHDDLEDINNLT